VSSRLHAPHYPQFWKRFDALPRSIKNKARDKFKLLTQNPSHPSLHFKKIGDFWSARVGRNYRALAVEDNKDFIWVWIGNHDDYIQMLQ